MIALARPFNLPTRSFSLPTPAINLAIRVFSVLTRKSREFELISRNLCFTFPQDLSF